jgi:acyl-coenzyme A thioesterase PaaI-like protein
MEPLDPHVFGPLSPCFGCSPTHPIGLRLTFEKGEDEVVTRFVPSERFQGPPGMMHGGLVTTVADEIAAWAVIGLRERMGFTASIEARLKRPLRIGVEAVGRGRIANATPRVLTVEVTLEQENVLCFQGSFSFVLLDRSGAERLLGTPLPPEWLRFCR